MLLLSAAVLAGPVEAAGFSVVPAVSARHGVLLRLVGRPAEASSRAFRGFRVYRDGTALADVLDSPGQPELLSLRRVLFTDEAWRELLARTQETLTQARAGTVGESPSEWVAAVKALPVLAQGFEISDWRAACMLGRAFLDPGPEGRFVTYEVRGLVAGERGLTDIALSGVLPVRVSPGVPTVVGAPGVWNVTPTLAHGREKVPVALQPPGSRPRIANGLLPDGAEDLAPSFLPPGGQLHRLAEKAHNTVYLKLATPQLPGATGADLLLIAFGFDVWRAPARGAYTQSPPPTGDPSWTQVNSAPVLLYEVPALPPLPETPPDAVLSALRAEIPDTVAAQVPGTASLDDKRAQLALQHWDASRSRASAETFRNADFDFGDRGIGLSQVPDADPPEAVWGPKTRYWYRAHGRNGFGEDGEASPAIRCHPYATYRPLPPRNLVAHKSGANRVTLQWQPPADPGALAWDPPLGRAPRVAWRAPAGYRVYRWKEAPGYPGRAQDPTNPALPADPGQLVTVLVPDREGALPTTCEDAGQVVDEAGKHQGFAPLEEGQTYWYRVVTVDSVDPEDQLEGSVNESLPSGPAWAVMYDETAPQAPGAPVVTESKPVPGQTCDLVQPLGGAVQITWAASPDPDVAGYLVFRAPALTRPEETCPLPGPLELLAQVTGPPYGDPYRPTDTTTLFYAVRALDRDRNLSPVAYSPPVVVRGSQPLPQPGFTKAVVEEAPWRATLEWGVSAPQGSQYTYEVWRAEVNLNMLTESDRVPDDVPPEGSAKLIDRGQVTGPGPYTAVDPTVAPGPKNLARHYWYTITLTELAIDARHRMSKARYVKVGGDALEPQHRVLPFPWGGVNPVFPTVEQDGTTAVHLQWSAYSWKLLSWVNYRQPLSKVLADLGHPAGVDIPVQYVVFRSPTSAESNFRQVSPLVDATGWRDADVLPGRTYHYQVLAFDLLTKELVGYTESVQPATVPAVAVLEPVELPVPNLKFMVDLRAGQASLLPLTLGASTDQLYDATGVGEVSVAVLASQDGVTTVAAERLGPLPLRLRHTVGAAPAAYQLRITALSEKARVKVTRSETPLSPSVPSLPEALQQLRLARLGSTTPIPQLDGSVVQVTKGDLTGDSRVDIGDAVACLRAVLGIAVLTDVRGASADSNSDGKLTIADALLILRHLLGLDESEKVALVSTQAQRAA
ncbi:MAG TPA: dockerin type I domain-containing protein [Armatimonadota bacterium]|jgi:hypothetical protein